MKKIIQEDFFQKSPSLVTSSQVFALKTCESRTEREDDGEDEESGKEGKGRQGRYEPQAKNKAEAEKEKKVLKENVAYLT